MVLLFLFVPFNEIQISSTLTFPFQDCFDGEKLFVVWFGHLYLLHESQNNRHRNNNDIDQRLCVRVLSWNEQAHDRTANSLFDEIHAGIILSVAAFVCAPLQKRKAAFDESHSHSHSFQN
jgi:hypothetical protein